MPSLTPATAPTRARQQVKEHDVLVSMTRPNLNAVAIVGADLHGAVASTGFDVLRSLGVHPDWISYRVQTQEFISDVCDGLQGVVYPAIRPHDVRRHKVPIPPESEQVRIVEAIGSYLTRLDDAVVTLERVQRNLKGFHASVLRAAVEGRLVPTEAEMARAEERDYEPAAVYLERILAERRCSWEKNALAKLQGKTSKNDRWKANYKVPIGPNLEGLPELPEGWCWTTLPQLGELNRGKSKHRPRNDPRLLGGPYPFIQTGDVRNSDGFITKHDATYSEFGLSQSRLWPPGTLCITIAANIAETGILGFQACFPDSVVGFYNESHSTLVRFVELFMRTAKTELERYAPATAQKNINLEVLARVAVPLPPAAEQVRIVAELDRMLSVGVSTADETEHNLLRLNRLRQSVLKWAFEGRLVDQYPSDEPAAVLLERIKAKRAASAPAVKNKNSRRKRKRA
jgi:type I restriction enzyme, S subunit